MKLRVISPSKSLSIIDKSVTDQATKKLNSLGYEVYIAENAFCTQKFYECGTIEKRIEDINNAFKSDADIIMTSIGGYNCNQLLPHIDYDLIKNNPKKLCGFSDITALLNAIYAKTGIITYYGPHFSSFGMKKGLEYTVRHFINIFDKGYDEIDNSKYYRDDLWFINQENYNKRINRGMVVLNSGEAEGTILGGNLCTFNLLQGTEFMPNAKSIILFLEDDSESAENFLLEFDRNLESLMQTEIWNNVTAMVIGRCQIASKMTIEKWKKLFSTKKNLKNIPIIINANFGHTTPIVTIPIGGHAIISKEGKIKMEG